MKSLQHVLWRGALALSLMAVGIGSGVGMSPVEQASMPANCPADASAFIAERTAESERREAGETLIVGRRAFTPAG